MRGLTLLSASSTPQLFLDQEAWLQWRMIGCNSFDKRLALYLAGGVQAITAIYFVGSALHARRYLSGSEESEYSTKSAANVANRAAMQRLMGRVLTSGCLMLGMTIISGAGWNVVVHPLGFTAVFIIVSPIAMVNSILQLASFAPPAGAPAGPMEESMRALKRAVHSVVGYCDGSARAQSQRAGHKRLRFLIGEGPQPMMHGPAEGTGGGRSRMRRTSVTGGSTQSVSVVPEEPVDTKRSQTSLPPCERLGVSYEFLLAVSESWAVPSTMKTHELCSTYIRPATVKNNCCFTDLLVQTDCPEDWLGAMDVFISHW